MKAAGKKYSTMMKWKMLGSFSDDELMKIYWNKIIFACRTRPGYLAQDTYGDYADDELENITKRIENMMNTTRTYFGWKIDKF